MLADSLILDLILLSLFIVAFAIQLYFYAYLFVKVFRYKSDNGIGSQSEQIPVSIIIAARNEATNLKENLPSVLNQKYSKFEVIVVNDYSSDNTLKIVEDFQKTYKNIKLVDNKGRQGKKYALTSAIEFAENDFLLFTDADCFPASENWLSLMASTLKNGKSLVLGYGAYITDKSLLSKFINYDSLIISLQYFGSAITGFPYMGVGRNIGYTKNLWKKTGGFSNHLTLKSGDDDLFVSEAGNNDNTGICLNPDSFTYSYPANNIKTFIRQKTRHLSTASSYNYRSLFYSGAEILSRGIFLICFVASLFTGFYILTIPIFIIRLICASFFIEKITIKNNNQISFVRLILFDIFAPFFYSILFFYNLLKHSNKEW